MPGPGGTPEYLTDTNNTTDEPPEDFPDGTDIADIDCSSATLIALNDYIAAADGAASGVLALMPPYLTYIQQDKMNSAAYLANAVAAKANFNAEVVTINNSYAAAIDAILVNEEGAMNDTITAAELVTSALSGISIFSTTEEELTLLLNQAKIDEKNRKLSDKELKKQAKLEEKRRIKEEKELKKQIKIDEKRRIKEEKELEKQIKIDEKKAEKIRKHQKNNIKKNKSTKIGTPAGNIEIPQEKFQELVKKIIKRNSSRSYPEINDIPK